jgi:hypothetical protein
MFMAWRRMVADGQTAVPLPDVKTRAPTFTLYTDASRIGWGAVLICLLTGRIFITGRRWPPDHRYEINKDEMAAVRWATEDFAQHFTPGTVIDLRVDNTSTEAGANKGTSSSWGVSRQLNAFMEKKKEMGINMRASHVDTKENWADPISRMKPLKIGDKGIRASGR